MANSNYRSKIYRTCVVYKHIRMSTLYGEQCGYLPNAMRSSFPSLENDIIWAKINKVKYGFIFYRGHSSTSTCEETLGLGSEAVSLIAKLEMSPDTVLSISPSPDAADEASMPLSSDSSDCC